MVGGEPEASDEAVGGMESRAACRPFTYLTGSLTLHFRKSSWFPYFPGRLSCKGPNQDTPVPEATTFGAPPPNPPGPLEELV